MTDVLRQWNPVPMQCRSCNKFFMELCLEQLTCEACTERVLPNGFGTLDGIRDLLCEVLSDECSPIGMTYTKEQRGYVKIYCATLDDFILSTPSEVAKMGNEVLSHFHASHAEFLRQYLWLRGYKYTSKSRMRLPWGNQTTLSWSLLDDLAFMRSAREQAKEFQAKLDDALRKEMAEPHQN